MGMREGGGEMWVCERHDGIVEMELPTHMPCLIQKKKKFPSYAMSVCL